MGNLTILEDIMSKKLDSVHTAFMAKVISFNGSAATVQPLQQNTSIIPNVPVVHSARYKLVEQTINRLVNGNSGCTATITGNVTVSGTAVAEGSQMTSTGTMSGSGSVACSCYSQSFVNLVKAPIGAGDIVVCVCCERNISSSLKGNVPSTSEPSETHSLSNSVVVGVL